MNFLSRAKCRGRGIRKFARQIRNDSSGLAVIEFAISLPFFMGLTVGGFELANYAQTLMKLNQITIHTADSAARMGEGDPLVSVDITERDINDVFAGTIREGESLLLDGQHQYIDPSDGEAKFRGNARIILSSVEPVSPFDADDPKFRIRWQRCVGQADYYDSTYGDVDTANNIDGIGPSDRKIIPPDDTAVMFVELQYYFRPLIVNGFAKMTEKTITQTAGMVVRDRRNYSQIYHRDNSISKRICNGAGGGDDYVELDGT